jgi:flagellar protein FliL
MANEAGNENAEQAKPKSKMKLIILIVVPVLLLGGLAATYFLYGDQILGRETGEKKEEKKHEAVGPILTLEPFIFNLASNTTRFAKVSLAIELKDAKVVEEAKKITPVLRDKALSVLSAKTPEVLIDVQSREPLKQELIAGLKGLLKPGELRSVYITDIIIP